MKRVMVLFLVIILALIPFSVVGGESPDAGGDYSTARTVATGLNYNASLDKSDPNNTDLMDYWKFPVTWGALITIDFGFSFDSPGANNWFYVQMYGPDPADNVSAKTRPNST